MAKEEENNDGDALIGCGCIATIVAGVVIFIGIVATVIKFGIKIIEWIWT